MPQFSVCKVALLAAMTLASALYCAPAAACSMGPTNPDNDPLKAEKRLRDSDIVAEITVISIEASSPRKMECAIRIEAAKKRCKNGAEDPFCDNFVEQYMEDCWPSGEATINFAKIWKGQVSGPMTMLYETPHDAICDSGMELELGSTVEICGDIDDQGRLQAGLCWTNAQYVFDRYRDKWHELKGAVRDNPRDIDAHIKLAEFYEYWNDRRGAVTTYADICGAAVQIASGCAGAGRVLFGQERYAEAVPYLQRAFDRDPANKHNADLLRRAKTLAQQ